MRAIEELRIPESSDKSEMGSVVTIGVFDGVHRGHMHLINNLKNNSNRMQSIIITFRQHPLSILDSSFTPEYLCSVEDRLMMLKNTGIDVLIAIDFDREISELTAKGFIQLLCKNVNLKTLVVGPGFALGHKREGDIPTLRKLGKEHGFNLKVVNPLIQQASLITSTSIRQALKNGEIQKATDLLGRKFELKGTIVKGDGIGNTIGFPTANLISDGNIMIPNDGIYATWAYFNDSSGEKKKMSATSIGIRPTFGKGHRTVESYILDYQGDLYGQTMTLEFVKRIREQVQYQSVDLLIDQMNLDVSDIREILDN